MSRTYKDMPLRAQKSTQRWRGCGDKHCSWCSENRQNAKNKQKAFAESVLNEV